MYPNTGLITHYDESDGLHSSFIESGNISDGNGNFFIPANKGFFTFIKPEKVAGAALAAKPIFTGFYILSRPQVFNPNSDGRRFAKVHHDENVLRFDFTNLEFHHPQRITYEYQLAGFDKQWLSAGKERSISYTNLDDGKYVFRVRAVNSADQNKSEFAEFELEVWSYFWEKPWFLWLFTSTTGMILLLVYFKYREKQRLRLIEIRDNIARDLHDDMGSNLSSISILSQNVEKLNKLDPERARQTLKKISETARDVMNTMNDIVWSVNPQKDSMYSMVERMNAFANECLEVKDIQMDFHVEKDLLKLNLSPDIRKEVFLIYKEAFSNIIQYAEPTNIHFRLYREGRFILMFMEDNGAGFDAANPPIRNSGNGLTNMRNRAEKIGGSIDIRSQPKSGTKILLRFKID